MKEKDFRSLGQLSRIEYLLSKQEIKYPGLESISFLFLIVPLILSIIILGFLIYSQNGNLIMLSTSFFMLKVSRIIFLFLLFIDILSIVFYFYKIKKFDKEFLERNF